MSARNVVLKNIAWNWGGMTCDAVAAFILTPFLVHRLGDTVYGLWILIGSLSSYFGLLDLGVRASVGRFAAYHRAKGDRAAVDATVSTSLAISSAVGLLVLATTAGVVWIFFGVFDVPADRASAVRVALVLVCVNLAVSFPLNIFDGTLWAAQRFDLLNGVDIPATGLRVALSYYAVERGYGLVGLAVLTLAITLTSGLVKVLLSFREDRDLRIGTAHVSRESARELFGYGLCNFAITVTRMTRAQMSPFLIGSLMGLPMVTVYSIAKRLYDYAERVVGSASGVVAPMATALHAQERQDRQRGLFIEGGRFCMAFALFFLTAFALLGKPFILLWVGPKLLQAAALLVILTAGECLPLSQSITGCILMGMGRPKLVTWLFVVELAIGLPLAAALAGPWGLTGVCFALAMSGTIFRGVALLVYGCRVVGVPLSRYFARSLLPPVLLAIIPALALSGAVAWRPPDRWPSFFAHAVLFTTLYALSCLPLLGRDRLGSLLRMARIDRFRREVVGVEGD
jgi:O-antigen/teichoic acid export membrane protein